MNARDGHAFRTCAPQLLLEAAMAAMPLRPCAWIPRRLLADDDRAHRRALQKARLRREEHDSRLVTSEQRSIGAIGAHATTHARPVSRYARGKHTWSPCWSAAAMLPLHLRRAAMPPAPRA